MRKTRVSSKITPRPHAEEWTAYERYWFSGGRQESEPTIIVRAPGEAVPTGFPMARPATKDEIAAEQDKRAKLAGIARQREAFEARPEYKEAHLIRSTIEMMEHDNHPLDRLTPEEWRALRVKLCGGIE